ncbi:MAG: hypothetical protein ACE5R4_02665, partial [Armatimonadota bacterium]
LAASIACSAGSAQGDLEAVFRSPPPPPDWLTAQGLYGSRGTKPALNFGDLKTFAQRGFAAGELGGWSLAALDLAPTPPEEAVRAGEQPYWRYRAGLELYMARLAAMGARGEHVVDVAAPAWGRGDLHSSDVVAGWQRFYRDLSLRQVNVGMRPFKDAKAVVLPPLADLPPAEVSKLAEFANAGGTVVAFQKLPDVEGIAELFGVEPGAQVREDVKSKGSAHFVPRDINRVVQLLRRVADDVFFYPPSNEAIVSHRRDANADWYLVCNLDVWPFLTYATFRATGMPEIWDVDTGEIRPANGCEPQDGKTIVPLSIPPGGTIFVVFRKPVEDWQIRRAPGLEVTDVSRKGEQVTVRGIARVNSGYHVWLHDGRTAGVNVTDLPEVLQLGGSWRFETEKAFDRQPAQIATVKAKAADAKDDTSRWASADLDDSAWTVTSITEPLPAAESAWHANWLEFAGDNAHRFFRKAFEVPGEVARATLTITCDNGYDLYLNGEALGSDDSWEQAETYAITDRLRPGRNVIAVDARNAGGVAALLAEVYALLKNGQALRVVTDGTWKMSEAAAQGWQSVDFDDSGWQAPRVGGQPPVSPWGNVPGLPAEAETGKALWYRFPLPPGATVLRFPDVGEASLELHVAGKKVAIQNGRANVAKLSGIVALRVMGLAALPAPIVAECGPGAVGIGSWASQGYAGYVGSATYSRSIQLPAAYRGQALVLDLGEVGCVAEVKANGKQVGTRLWAPYQFDLGTVKGRQLRLTITVANTLAAAQEEGAPPSGILGPVLLKPYKEITIKL